MTGLAERLRNPFDHITHEDREAIADYVAALETQIAAADRLADAWADFDKPLLQFGSFGEMRKTAREHVAAYRAAKGG